jgi:hypothetical protein
MGLGPTHTINADGAREKARICRQQVLASIDPLVAREKAECDRRLVAAKDVTFLARADGRQSGLRRRAQCKRDSSVVSCAVTRSARRSRRRAKPVPLSTTWPNGRHVPLRHLASL